MAQTRFICSLTRADEPACQSYAGVTIVDSEGATARGSPRHAVAAPLDGITGAHGDWADSKGLNQWERKAWSSPRNGANCLLRGDEDQGVMVPPDGSHAGSRGPYHRRRLPMRLRRSTMTTG
jgi:hypothetical protein